MTHERKPDETEPGDWLEDAGSVEPERLRDVGVGDVPVPDPVDNYELQEALTASLGAAGEAVL